MPNYERLTDRTIATGVSENDIFHIVITGDTSQNPAGSSYKATIKQLSDALPKGKSPYVVTTNGTQVTGTTTATISRSYLLSGGTITSDCILEIQWGILAQSSNTIQPRLYINTTNSLIGATQIATGLNITNSGQTSNINRLVMVDRTSEKFRIPQSPTATISNWLSTSPALNEYTVDLDNDIWFLFANHHPSGGTSVVYFASIQIIQN
jgi:hypothetical protein